jgi:hypothetical protein
MGYKSIFDLIATETQCNYSWGIPLFFAVLYTFAAPLFRNVINAFNAWMTKWGNKWFFSISKDSYISTSRFLKLREKYEKLSFELKKLTFAIV